MLNGGPLSLRSLNHISILCRSLEESIKFYENVLGFLQVKRPGSFDFDGAWLFNYGIGIHLLKAADPSKLPVKTEINPKDNHISFQCEDMMMVERKLQDLGIKYIKRIVEEGGVYVDQLFFHDPDGFMVEICNCENLPVEPISSMACLRIPSHLRHQPGQPISISTKEHHQIHQPSVAEQMIAACSALTEISM